MKPVANSILTNIMFIIECLVYTHYVDVFLWRYTIYCICLNEEGLFLNLQMNSKCTHVSLTFSICRDLNLNYPIHISFFDILVVNIAMYTLIQYRHNIVRYRTDIDKYILHYRYCRYFYIVNIIDIINIATSTMLDRYRVYIVDIVDISLTLSSLTLSTSQ